MNLIGDMLERNTGR